MTSAGVKVKADSIKQMFGIPPHKENRCILRINDKETKSLALNDIEMVVSRKEK